MIGHRVTLYRKEDPALRGTLIAVNSTMGVVLQDPENQEFATAMIPWSVITGIVIDDNQPEVGTRGHAEELPAHDPTRARMSNLNPVREPPSDKQD